jgi:uncharacterized tellurite resistance protein B-like protein
MIDLIKNIFSKCDRQSNNQNKDCKRDILVATCALFLEMAAIDGEFSDSERNNILTILERDYDLSPEYINSLMESSRHELNESIDLWQFTNMINQNYSLDEKINIMEMVWKLAYADGNLDSHEDYLTHKIANLLRLNHKQLIDAKMKVLNQSRGN